MKVGFPGEFYVFLQSTWKRGFTDEVDIQTWICADFFSFSRQGQSTNCEAQLLGVLGTLQLQVDEVHNLD